MFHIPASSRAERGDRKILRLRRRFTPRNDVKFAFTLAEVLITLLIIGVVSSIVLPAVIQDTQDAELKTALKKTYSTLSQAYTHVLMDNAGSIKNACSGNYTNSGCLKNLFTNYFSISKTCANSAAQGCWHLATNWYYLNPNSGCGYYAGILDNCSNKTNSLPGYILNDGSFITFFLFDGACEDNTWTNFNKCAYISIDVNGFKKPNTVGKDIFAIWMSENKISPLGYNDTYIDYCSVNAGVGYNKAGWGCTAQRLKE